MTDSMFCEHGAPRGGICSACDEKIINARHEVIEMSQPISPKMEEAVISTFYHHPMGGRTILELLMKREFSTPPPIPTAEQKLMAHDITEELLRVHYQNFNSAMQEVLGEDLEDNPYI